MRTEPTGIGPKAATLDPFGADDLILAYALLQAVIALLLVRFLDLYEREPIAICALMFLWGAIVAAIGASLGNTALQGELPRDVDAVFGPAISAPVVEELAKGLALVIAFVASRWAGRRFGVFEFDGVTDGIVYGAAVGIGFAFTEDLYYFFREARVSGVGDALSVFIDRRDFFGPAMLRHAIWTATFGAGLGRRDLVANVAGDGSAGRCSGSPPRCSCTRSTTASSRSCSRSSTASRPPTSTWRSASRSSLADRMDASAESAAEALKWISWAYVVLFFAGIALWLRHQRRVIREELADRGRRRPDHRRAGGDRRQLHSPQPASSSPRCAPATWRPPTAPARCAASSPSSRSASGASSGLDDAPAQVERRRECVRDVLRAR